MNNRKVAVISLPEKVKGNGGFNRRTFRSQQVRDAMIRDGRTLPPPGCFFSKSSKSSEPKPVEVNRVVNSVSPDEYERPDALRLYLQNIVKMPRVTPEEEVELARKIKRGDGEARERMINANLLLVVAIAQNYRNRGLPLLDLISEGNIGLTKAVDRFDPRKGAKLSTYSAWWIRQQIFRALANDGKPIRIPVHLVPRVSRIARMMRDSPEREITDNEIAEKFGISVKRARTIKDAAEMSVVSLQVPAGECQLEDLIEDTKSPNPLAELTAKSDTKYLFELLKQIPEREAKVLWWRYDLDGKGGKTLDEISRIFKVTRERVRQLQVKAKKRLRGLVEHHKRRLEAGFTF